mmetsp:Transcript_10971/g.24991  ORF Transcript_10971/g.24991 Transcript_10971/m.24991 type:complete len:278 (-) Transcript_10971:3167-4000(-)
MRLARVHSRFPPGFATLVEDVDVVQVDHVLPPPRRHLLARPLLPRHRLLVGVRSDVVHVAGGKQQVCSGELGRRLVQSAAGGRSSDALAEQSRHLDLLPTLRQRLQHLLLVSHPRRQPRLERRLVVLRVRPPPLGPSKLLWDSLLGLRVGEVGYDGLWRSGADREGARLDLAGRATACGRLANDVDVHLGHGRRESPAVQGEVHAPLALGGGSGCRPQTRPALCEEVVCRVLRHAEPWRRRAPRGAGSVSSLLRALRQLGSLSHSGRLGRLATACFG